MSLRMWSSTASTLAFVSLGKLTQRQSGLRSGSIGGKSTSCASATMRSSFMSTSWRCSLMSNGRNAPELIACAARTMPLAAAWRKMSVNAMLGTLRAASKSRNRLPGPTDGS